VKKALRRRLLMIVRDSVESLLLLRAEPKKLSANPVRLNAGPMLLSNAPGAKAGFLLIRAGVMIGTKKSPHPSLRLTDLDGE
jgi:hypothetical protein